MEVSAWLEDVIMDRWWKHQTAPTTMMKKDLKDLVRELLQIRSKLDISCRTSEAVMAKSNEFSSWRQLSIESE